MEEEKKKPVGKHILLLAVGGAVALVSILILFPLFISDIYLQRGLTASESGDGIKAEKLLNTALFWDDDNPEIYLALGDVYAKASHVEMLEFLRTHKRTSVIRTEPPVLVKDTKGTEIFEEPVKVKELTPKDVRVNIRKGNRSADHIKEEIVYSFPAYPGSDHGYEKRAVEMFRKGIELNPYDSRLYHGCARMMQFAATVPQTEAVFRKAAELDPNNPNIYYSFALFYLRKNKHMQGVLNMGHAVSIYPFRAGDAYAAWRQNGGRFDELKAIAGASPTALWKLGLFFERQGYKGRAADAFLTACQVIGGNSAYRFPNELSPGQLLPNLLKKVAEYGYTEEKRYFQNLWEVELEEK
jgi:tetratricopeptide (TPR) repeat protein